MDLSNLSNEELLALSQKNKSLSDLSDEELLRLSKDKTWKDTAANIVKTVNLPVVTSALGGISGGLLGLGGGVVAAPAGAVTGAGLGAAGGKSLENTLLSLLGKTEELPKTAKDITKQQIGEFLSGASSEVLGAGAMSGLSKVLAPLSKRITPEVSRLLKVAESKDIPITAGQATKTNILEQAEKLSENIPWTTGVVQKIQEKQKTGLTKFSEEIKDIIGKPKDLTESGSAIYKGFGKAIEDFKSEAAGKFKRFAEMGKGVVGKLDNIKSALNELIEREAEYPESQRNQSILKMASGLREDLYKVNYLGVEKLSKIRSRLGELAKSKEALDNQTTGAFKHLKSSIDKDIEQAAKSGGDELLTTYRDALSYYRKGKEVFNESVLSKIKDTAEANPEKVASMIIRPKSPTTIRLVKKHLGEEYFNPVKYRFTDELLSKAMASDNVQSLTKMLDDYGEETLKEIYKPNELSILRTLADIKGMARSAPKAGKETGLGLLGTGLLFGGAYKAPLATLSTIIGTRGMSEFLFSKAGRKFLTTGVKAPNIQPLFKSVYQMSMQDFMNNKNK